MKITQALFVSGYSSFYFDDQKVIKEGAAQDGFVYVGQPATPGFRAIRQAGECVSVLLRLEDGSVRLKRGNSCVVVRPNRASALDPFNASAQIRPRLLDRC